MADFTLDVRSCPMSPAAWLVVAAFSSSRSSTSTSRTPARARCQAAAQPRMPPPTIATRARRARLTPPGGGRSRQPVQREVERVEVAHARAGRQARAAVQHDRHALLGEPAGRAERRVEPPEIVLRGRGAGDGVALADDDDVAGTGLPPPRPPARLLAVGPRPP